MTLPTLSFFRSEPEPQLSAIVHFVTSRDVQWNRPVFKAPPLRVKPGVPDVREFSSTGGRVFSEI